MSKFGLTKERYEQMMTSHRNDEEWVKEIVDEWGAENCNKGYAIFDFNGTGMIQIEAIGDVDAFNDEEAAEYAIKDGIKIIPVEELPENFDRRYLGWIDTPENRKAIKKYCNADTYKVRKYLDQIYAESDILPENFGNEILSEVTDRFKEDDYEITKKSVLETMLWCYMCRMQ